MRGIPFLYVCLRKGKKRRFGVFGLTGDNRIKKHAEEPSDPRSARYTNGKEILPGHRKGRNGIGPP